MRIPKQWWLLTLSIIFIFPCGFFNNGPPRLTQAEAAERAGILCLPTYLPAEVDPNPEFYGVLEDFYFPLTLYKDSDTSERVVVILMDNISTATLVQRGEYRRFDPYYQDCEDRFELPNGFRVCNASALPYSPDFLERLPGEGPPFITGLAWLMHRDETWTRYSLDSTLSLEETKKIAASMCLE